MPCDPVHAAELGQTLFVTVGGGGGSGVRCPAGGGAELC